MQLVTFVKTARCRNGDSGMCGEEESVLLDTFAEDTTRLALAYRGGWGVAGLFTSVSTSNATKGRHTGPRQRVESQSPALGELFLGDWRLVCPHETTGANNRLKYPRIIVVTISVIVVAHTHVFNDDLSLYHCQGKRYYPARATYSSCTLDLTHVQHKGD